MATHRLVIEGTEYEVQVGPRADNTVHVAVNGKEYEVEVTGTPSAAPVPAAAAPALAPAPAPAAPKPAAASGGSGDVRAPISGVVLRVAVQTGQSVKAGDLILVLEAMKMENEIFSPVNGTVASISAQAQQEVAQGDPLLSITPG